MSLWDAFRGFGAAVLPLKFELNPPPVHPTFEYYPGLNQYDYASADTAKQMQDMFGASGIVLVKPDDRGPVDRPAMRYLSFRPGATLYDRYGQMRMTDESFEVNVGRVAVHFKDMPEEDVNLKGKWSANYHSFFGSTARQMAWDYISKAYDAKKNGE